jgi:hypothetical protein
MIVSMIDSQHASSRITSNEIDGATTSYRMTIFHLALALSSLLTIIFTSTAATIIIIISRNG